MALLLRVGGHLPTETRRNHTDTAGVRQASGEETAGRTNVFGAGSRVYGDFTFEWMSGSSDGGFRGQ